MSEREHGPEAEFDGAELAALESILREPELGPAEWSELRHTVNASAALPLAERRRTAARGRALRWFAPIPLAAAAMALLLLVGRGEQPPVSLTPAEDALLADVSEAEFSALVSGGADAEALLLMAVSEE